jgi:hypothetical protein
MPSEEVVRPLSTGRVDKGARSDHAVASLMNGWVVSRYFSGRAIGGEGEAAGVRAKLGRAMSRFRLSEHYSSKERTESSS